MKEGKETRVCASGDYKIIIRRNVEDLKRIKDKRLTRFAKKKKQGIVIVKNRETQKEREYLINLIKYWKKILDKKEKNRLEKIQKK